MASPSSTTPLNRTDFQPLLNGGATSSSSNSQQTPSGSSLSPSILSSILRRDGIRTGSQSQSQSQSQRVRRRLKIRLLPLCCSAVMFVFMLLMLGGLLWDFFFGPQQLSLFIGFLACMVILLLTIGVRRNLRIAFQTDSTTATTAAATSSSSSSTSATRDEDGYDDIENRGGGREGGQRPQANMVESASRRRLIAQVLAANSSSERLSMQQLRLSLIERDFTSDDYEALLALDREIQEEQHLAQGASQTDIDRLPTITIPFVVVVASTRADDSEQQPLLPPSQNLQQQQTTANVDSRWASLLRKICPICLEFYQCGDTIRTLPCLHQFHSKCVDQWLSIKAKCPMGCKVDLFAESPR